MLRIRVIALWLVLVSSFAAAFVTAQQTTKSLFDQAQARKAAGDLQGAIEGFERIVSDFGASDRNTVAKALLGLGEMFESLGQTSRSRAYYERVQNEFKDQQAEASIASARLTQAASRDNPLKVTIRTPYAEDVYSFAISPDGRMLVFQSTTPEGKRQLWREAVDASQKPEPIAGTEGAGHNSFPFFSPDGRSIAFFKSQKLWQVDVAGGTPKELANAPSPNGGSWIGGSILFSGRGIGGALAVIENGKARNVTTARGLFKSPKFLDDRRIMYYSGDTGGVGKIEIGTIERVTLTTRGIPPLHAAAYIPGYFVYVTPAGSLNALSFNLNGMAASGTPTVIAERVGKEDRYRGTATFAVSANGSVAYRETATLKRQMMWMDRTGALLATVGVPDTASPGNPRLSPDGRAVLFFRQAGAPMGSAWLMDTTLGVQKMFQDGSLGGVWSAGGDKATLASQTNGAVLNTRPINGGTSVTLPIPSVRAGMGEVVPDDWAENGNLLYRLNTASGSDLWVLPPNQGAPIAVLPIARK